MPSFDQGKADAFANKVEGDFVGALTTVMCTLGDRLGLFRALAAHGPATSEELAGRAGVHERYAREWLGALVCAGYLDYDPTQNRFTLPPEHAPILADEGGVACMGGRFQYVPALVGVLDELTNVFHTGGGVTQSSYVNHLWEGWERAGMGQFTKLLSQEWVPAMPDVMMKLAHGAAVADVGCGRGWALIRLAQAFPACTCTGYDVFVPTIAAATANAQAAGVGDRVRFVAADAAQGLPQQYDVITTFEVVHDAIDPAGLLRSIRAALRPGGRYVCLDMNCSQKLEENVGIVGTFLYSMSVLYCLTTSLAGGGAGLGTAGLPEAKLRALCAEAGFSSVRRVPLENAFNILYEVAV